MQTRSIIPDIRDQASSTAERKVAAALLEGWPSSSIGTVEQLATRAGVSGPTVLRFLAKIGFDRFSDFQAQVVAEIQQQLGSPLLVLESGSQAEAGAGEEHLYRRTLLFHAECLRKAAENVVPAEFDAMVDLLADRRLTVHLLGGRYSRFLAQHFEVQLAQIRPGVRMLEQQLGFAYDALVDLGPKDVILILDYRRYQDELLIFARAAHKAGVHICLLTDIGRSPISSVAEAVLAGGSDTLSPFESKVVVEAQIEALITAIVERDRAAVRKRLSTIEDLRQHSGAPAGKPSNELR